MGVGGGRGFGFLAGLGCFCEFLLTSLFTDILFMNFTCDVNFPLEEKLVYLNHFVLLIYSQAIHFVAGSGKAVQLFHYNN